MSGGVARCEQASDVQSTHLDLVALTHLPDLSTFINHRMGPIHPLEIYLLRDSLNPVITTKNNQPWHLQIC